MRKLQNSGATFGMVSSAAACFCSGVASTTLTRVLLQQQAEAQVVLVLFEQRTRRFGLVAGPQLLELRVGDHAAFDARQMILLELSDAGDLLGDRSRGDEAEQPRNMNRMVRALRSIVGKAECRE